MGQRSQRGWIAERRWNALVLNLIVAAVVAAAFFAVTAGPDWVDATRRFGHWMAAGALSIETLDPTEVGALAGLAGLVLLAVLGAVIGASPLAHRSRGLVWLVVGVAVALIAGSAYAALAGEPPAGNLPGWTLGLLLTLAEVLLVAATGYGLGWIVRDASPSSA